MDDVFGKRYGEVLLVRLGDAGPQATVYNTFPLNDCPADLWGRLDAQAIATENGAAAALLNGPRYWLMSHIEKAGGTELETRTFGGIEMLRQAEVIYCMTRGHRDAVVSLLPGAAGKTVLLDDRGDIEDPIGAAVSGYVRCARRIQQAVRKRLDQLAVPASVDGAGPARR